MTPLRLLATVASAVLAALVFALVANPRPNLHAVGAALFFEKSISRGGRLACTSCHGPGKWFQDGLPRAVSRGHTLTRNTPTTLNVLAYSSYFWDGRAPTLEAQLEGPLLSVVELGATEASIAKFLRSEPEYDALWQNSQLSAVAFARRALADYLRAEATTTTLWRSRGFQPGALALEGERLFFGRARCAECHAGRWLTDNRFHDIGLQRVPIVPQYILRNGRRVDAPSPDLGRGNIVSGLEHLYRFRTPSLINVGYTAPYMRDGRYRSLEDVVAFYGDTTRTRGVVVSLNVRERAALVAFLDTLGDVRGPRP